jgi:uncharacterized protein (TIGR03437 family)
LIMVDSGAASDRQITFYNPTFQQIGVVTFAYPTQNWDHSTGMGLEVQQPDGSVQVFFIIGSQADQAPTNYQVATSGLFRATLNEQSIYMVTLQVNGNSLQVTGPPVQLAKGLRNPYGLTLDSAGNLIIGDNGQDGAHFTNELGADTLHMIPVANIGKVLYDFGFPNSYVEFGNGQYVNGDPAATPPLAAFIPVADSNGVLQSSEGLSGMAFVPPGALPFAGAQGGEVITFHGVKDASGAANYDDAVLYYDFARGVYTPIVDAGIAGIGHIDSALVVGNSILLADFASNGLVDQTGGDNTGVIYQFTISAVSPVVASVVNAASGASGPLAPGEIVTIKGGGLGPAAAASFSIDPSTGMLDTTLAGTRVLFGSFAAPLTYTSVGQVNAIVPYEVAGLSTVSMQVQDANGMSAGATLQVASAAPGAFTVSGTGSGQAVAANQDYSFNGASNPAAKGSYVTIYFTGGGQTNPAGVTGGVTGDVLKWLVQPATATVGGVSATVTFDGSAPTFVDGVGQLDIQLANNTPSGIQPLVITVGGIPSPATATLAVQ